MSQSLQRTQAVVVCVAGIKIRIFGAEQESLALHPKQDDDTRGGPSKRTKSSGNATAPKPVVFVSHGRLQTVAKIVPICLLLARNDMVAIAIEARNHGERLVDEIANHGWNRNPLHESDMYSMQLGTAMDISTVLDFLPCRFPNLSLERVGVTGVSLGGHIAFLSMAMDSRVAVACPIIGSANYKLMMEIRVYNFRRRLEKKQLEATAKQERMMNNNGSGGSGSRRTKKKNKGGKGTGKDKDKSGSVGTGGSNDSSVVASSSNGNNTSGVGGGGLEEVDEPPFAPYSQPLLQLIRKHDPIFHASAFADRPLLICSGKEDTLVPTVCNLTFMDAARVFYSDQRRLQLVEYDGVGHRVTPRMVRHCVAWFRYWLIDHWDELDRPPLNDDDGREGVASPDEFSSWMQAKL